MPFTGASERENAVPCPPAGLPQAHDPVRVPFRTADRDDPTSLAMVAPPCMLRMTATLQAWFASLAPRAPGSPDRAAAAFNQAWSAAGQLPSLWAKASAVYSAAIALALDPTGRDSPSAAQEHSPAVQLAATKTALKQLLVGIFACQADAAGQRRRSSVATRRRASVALAHKKPSAFAFAPGSPKPWPARKSAKSPPSQGGGVTRTSSTNNPESVASTRQCTPATLLPIAAVEHLGDDDAVGWSDADDDADDADVDAAFDQEQLAIPAVDMKMTCHLTGGMQDSCNSATGFTDVLGDLNQFAVLERLGRGAEGEVFLAMDTTKSELRAIKAVRRPVSNGLTRVSAAAKQKLARIACEIAIMKRMRHRNVVTLHEVIDDPARDTMYFVLQYVEHGPIATLADDGTVSATVEPQRLVDYARQLCSGLQYLHSKGVIHRDIKPENILRGANDQVYLADFGVSENFDDAADDSRRIAGTRGTPAFLAPELLQLRSQRRHSLISEGGSDDGEAAALPTDVDGAAVDVWALGITLYVLLYGKLPWEFSNAKDLFDEIQRRPIELRQPVSPSPGLSPSFAHDAPGSCSSYAESPTFAGRMRPGSTVFASTPSISVTAMPPAADGSSAGLRRFAGVSPATPPLGPANGTSNNTAAPPMPDFANTSDCSDDGTSNNQPPQCHPSPSALTPHSHTSLGMSAANLSMTGPMARSFLPSGVMASNAADGWRRVLFGMLQRDPRKRSSLATLRHQLRALDRKLEQAAFAASPNCSSAFTKLQSLA